MESTERQEGGGVGEEYYLSQKVFTEKHSSCYYNRIKNDEGQRRICHTDAMIHKDTGDS